ncbi:GntR family transcriptional regulator [Glutamicibacter soli]|uniref:GntR family transcriptional regulator n=1 Tax=Micrococcaceae TaxID=1268 RepID=UPI00063DD012|nr:GntR family transcriptional regulator [Arthrobacter sp. YC-RL1]ALQ29369.1 GntR family transcriptional regulator [Arthrobacter sp. YC-RL1]KLI89241.1 GntR family transcriptional regulator [Arthrobacter sp. YC-RL1]
MGETTTAATRQPGTSLAEFAYGQLCQKLLTLDIVPGDPIREEALMAELEIGRTPLREALKRLELDKLVVSYPKRGTFATRVEISDLAYISEIRQVLEPMAAARAARVATDATRETLREVARDIETLDGDSGSIKELLTFDSRVHRSIYRACGNPHLEDSLIRYNNLGTRIWCTVADQLPHLNVHIKEHLQLLAAIIDGDEREASELAAEHVRAFEVAVREALLAK